jgi:hypothetical protein
MATMQKKKIHADKGKKKMAGPAKGKGKPKVKDEVCVIADLIRTEELYCCEDRCA